MQFDAYGVAVEVAREIEEIRLDDGFDAAKGRGVGDGGHGFAPIVAGFGRNPRGVDAVEGEHLVGGSDVGGRKSQSPPAPRAVSDGSEERIWGAEHFVCQCDVAFADGRADARRTDGGAVARFAAQRMKGDIAFAAKPAQVADIARFVVAEREIVAQDDGGRIERQQDAAEKIARRHAVNFGKRQTEDFVEPEAVQDLRADAVGMDEKVFARGEKTLGMRRKCDENGAAAPTSRKGNGHVDKLAVTAMETVEVADGQNGGNAAGRAMIGMNAG